MTVRFVYFEKVTDGVPRIGLRFHVRNTGAEDVLGTADLPFDVTTAG